MPTFEIGLKKIEYGHAIIQAKNSDEAKRKANRGELGKAIFYPGADIIKMDITEQKED